MRGDPGPVETEQHRFGEDAGDGEARDVIDAPDGVAELGDAGHGPGHGYELVGAPPRRGRLGGEPFAAVRGERVGHRAEADDAEEVLGAAAAPPLLGAAEQEWLEPDRATDDEGADPGRGPELVPAQRDEVRAEPVEVERHGAGGGGGVDVHGHRGPPTAVDDLGDGLERADLVVGELAVDEGEAGRPLAVVPIEEVVERREVEPAESVDGQLDLGRGTGRGVADAGVLDRGAGDLAVRAGPGRAEDRGVGRLGGTAREHEAGRGDADERRDLLTCPLDQVASGAALGVHPPGVAESPVVEQGLDRRGGLRPERARGGVVEVVASGHGSWGAVGPGAGLRRRVDLQPATVSQTSSPRALEESCTGTPLPQRPRSRPSTRPRSAADSTGWSMAASPKGQWSRTMALGESVPPACAAKPWAVSASATDCMAERIDFGASPGAICSARERPYSSPTSSASCSAFTGSTKVSRRASRSRRRSSLGAGTEASRSPAADR